MSENESENGGLVRTVVVPCHGSPYLAWIDPTLETYQSIVGGYIEAVRCGLGDVIAYANEEAILLGLPQNRNGCGILGDFVFAACDAEGRERGLTEAEAATVLLYVERNSRVVHPTLTGHGEITITPWPE
jgi:hypothetical protein